MFEIKGKVNTAICFAKVIDDAAIEQIKQMCDYKLTEGCKVRIMPDVHAGKGCTIGTTMTVKDKVCPNIVGVDIGCGMYTVQLRQNELDFHKIDAVCHYIPSGMNVWERKSILSREKMAEIFLERTGMTAVESFHTIHNYIDTKEMILRKGDRNME